MINKSEVEWREQLLKMQHSFESLQQDLQDFKDFERWKWRNQDYLRKQRDQRIKEEMKKGKDLKTVLSEMLDTDTLLLNIKNNKGLPRITRELLTEELISMKNND